MAILRPRSRTAVLVCLDFYVYATTDTSCPISSREWACDRPTWYARLGWGGESLSESRKHAATVVEWDESTFGAVHLAMSLKAALTILD